MKKGINDFCEEASQVTGWDDGEGRFKDSNGKNHKRVERVYNNDTDDQVVLLVSSTNDDLDNAFKQIDKDDCNSTMTKIFDECPPGQDIPGVDWRHGGERMDRNGLLWIIVTDRAKYYPGTCTFLVMENTWNEVEDQSKHHWATRTTISDAENNTITALADGWDEFSVEPYNSLDYEADLRENTVPGLYSELKIKGTITDEQQLQFTVGSYHFNRSTDLGSVPRCEVVDWWYDPPKDTNPEDFHGFRNTTCWVYC
jgi:hypothetical protein